MTRHTLFPHQRKALRKIRDEPRVALFLEMRLGKTPVIIRWAKRWMQERGRALVVAPLSVLADWDDELMREGIRRRDITHLEGLPKGKREEFYSAGWGWYLINYEGVRVTEDLADAKWDVIILDESTSIRNPQAQITKTLVREYSHVPYRAILTGDPIPEGIDNYFSQFHFLHGDFMSFGSYWAWRNVHFKQNPFQSWDWQPKPGVRDEVKKWVHTHAVVMTKQQVGIGGTKVYERRVIEQNPAQHQALKQLVKDFQYEYIETNFATVRDVWMARVAGGFSPDRENPELLSNAKTAEILNLLKGELKREQVVIWFRFNEELQHVWNALIKAGIRVQGVMGSTPVDKRKAIRDAFKGRRYQVLCVQIKLGRMGWDLSGASTAIYYSNAYEYESRSQSEERIEHPTKKEQLLYIDLVTRGTLDEEVVRLLREKKINAKAFMRQLNDGFLEQMKRLYGIKGADKTDGDAAQKVKSTHTGKKGAVRTPRRVYPGRG